jgi:hypothetical protein
MTVTGIVIQYLPILFRSCTGLLASRYAHLDAVHAVACLLRRNYMLLESVLVALSHLCLKYLLLVRSVLVLHSAAWTLHFVLTLVAQGDTTGVELPRKTDVVLE